MLLAIGTTGCSRKSADGPRDVVFILLDAVRRDHLSVYGYERDSSPNINKIAKEGVVFDRAYAPAPWTLATIASLFTANMPQTHGAGVWSDDRSHGSPTALSEHSVTLAERLKEYGYMSFCRSANAYISLGAEQGFDRSDTLPGNAKELVDWGLDAADEAGSRPMFLFLQFMDAHTARDLSDEFVNMYPTPGAGERSPRHRTFDPWIEKQFRGGDLKDFATNRIAVYDGAIHLIDREIGRLIKGLEKRGRLDRTWFVIVVDHGEEFWEHLEVQEKNYHDSRGYFGVGHGHTMFEELIQVPLILKGPEAKPGHRVQTPFSIVNVAPTLLDALGSGPKLGSYTFGKSAFETLKGAPLAREPIYSQQILYGHSRRAIIDIDDWKYIHSYDPRERGFLFNLNSDPKELNNLIDVERAKVEALKVKLETFFKSLPNASDFSPSAISDTAKDQLKGVGYLGGGKRPSSAPSNR
ncbi:MAG: sulfatase [Planctomycetota bacterium]